MKCIFLQRGNSSQKLKTHGKLEFETRSENDSQESGIFHDLKFQEIMKNVFFSTGEIFFKDHRYRM